MKVSKKIFRLRGRRRGTANQVVIETQMVNELELEQAIKNVRKQINAMEGEITLGGESHTADLEGF